MPESTRCEARGAGDSCKRKCWLQCQIRHVLVKQGIVLASNDMEWYEWMKLYIYVFSIYSLFTYKNYFTINEIF